MANERSLTVFPLYSEPLLSFGILIYHRRHTTIYTSKSVKFWVTVDGKWREIAICGRGTAKISKVSIYKSHKRLNISDKCLGIGKELCKNVKRITVLLTARANISNIRWPLNVLSFTEKILWCLRRSYISSEEENYWSDGSVRTLCQCCHKNQNKKGKESKFGRMSKIL